MVQLVRKGPDIPERLLQAHASGDVVFFCGAGISSPQLPGFKGLVKDLCKKFHVPKKAEKVLKKALKQERYEVAVEILGKHAPGKADQKRTNVRKEINNILKLGQGVPPPMHRTLLNLASYPRDSEEVRLVTTNFDRFFERTIGGDNIDVYKAPALPVPKGKWNGLVYLHGLLPKTGDRGLDDLVISSGDFGRAYILEQWAAHFVRELFRNYSICFVGYGVNDPVMRYLLDALAADSASGIPCKEMFAFASYAPPRGEEFYRQEWDEKSVTPILYRSHKGDHTLLHKTLCGWANMSQLDKGPIIQRLSRSFSRKKQDDILVEQVLWESLDASAAKRIFAEGVPVPPLELLGRLAYNHFNPLETDSDGGNTAVTADKQTDNNIKNQRLRAYYLFQWLLRHSNNPELLLWFAKKGKRLNSQFAYMINGHISDIVGMSDDRRAQIRAKSPDGVPTHPMRALWRLLLSGRVLSARASPDRDFDMRDWGEKLQNEGLSVPLRLQLREILSPHVIIGEKIAWDGIEQPMPATPQCASDIFSCHLNVGVRDKHVVMVHNKDNPRWREVLPRLLDDFTALLRDALDIMRELKEVDDKCDGSDMHLSSVEEHEQNMYTSEWTILAEFARDAWLQTKKTDSAKALRVAQEWQATPYPLFKRLAFFAATHSDIVPPRVALDWLLADDGWWLWVSETKRESIRLIDSLGEKQKLSAEEARELTNAILKRPPQGIYKETAPKDMLDRAAWLRLATANDAGMILDDKAKAELDVLAKKFGSPDEQDEFTSYMGTKPHIDDMLPDGYIRPPSTVPELVEWLKKPPISDGWHSDRNLWEVYCQKNLEVVIAAFQICANNNYWPAERWGGALNAWGRENFVEKSWQVAPMLIGAPDEVLQKIVHPFAWWLRAQGEKIKKRDGKLLLQLVRRVVNLRHDAEMSSDPLSDALNVPVGRAVDGLLHWQTRHCKKLDGEVRQFMTSLCDTKKKQFRPARVMLVSRLQYLFHIAEKWTATTLFPLLDWQKSKEEARAAWYGFLWQPPLYLPLMKEVKAAFLNTAKHHAQLGRMARQYAGALTLLALYSKEKPFSSIELREATSNLPEEGLCRAAEIVCRELNHESKDSGAYWRDSVSPYFAFVWPHYETSATPNIAEQIARICIAAKDDFVDAVEQLRYFLVPAENMGGVLYLVPESGVCEKFPETALLFLDAIMPDTVSWYKRYLLQCLEQIEASSPALKNRREFARLKKMAE